MILSDLDIRYFIQTGDIVIENFNNELEPASYDLRVGKEGMTEEGLVNISEKKYIKIPRGVTVVISSLERIKLSTKLAARFGLRSHFARKGLILLSGPQIDPGFEGILNITIFNAGTSEVVLSYEDKIATVEFFILKTPASKSYSGSYQRQTKISSEEIELIAKKYRNFSEIEDAITKTQADLDALKNFIYIVLFGIIVGSVIVILQELIFK